MKLLLYPIMLIYEAIVLLRNKFYDNGIFKSTPTPIPSIVIGNLSTGGTGKTPHTEYLIRLFRDKYNIATLSRGYKRKSRGFVMANENSRASDIGDEPLQFHVKFDDVMVCVDENRVHGVNNIVKLAPETNLILLDDAYQHRALKANIYILLFDYVNILNKRCDLIPIGTYREPLKSKQRADYIIVTNSDVVISPIVRRQIEETLSPLPHQKLLFSRVEYMSMIAINDTAKQAELNVNTILLFTGIADSYNLENYLRGLCFTLDTVKFGDHHNFSKKDILHVVDSFKTIPSRRKIVVITEKDYMRLYNSDILNLLNDIPVFYIPIKIVIHDGERAFDLDIDKRIMSV